MNQSFSTKLHDVNSFSFALTVLLILFLSISISTIVNCYMALAFKPTSPTEPSTTPQPATNIKLRQYSFVRDLGSHGTGDGQFNNPYDVAVDRYGTVYVADSSNHRIQKFTSDGKFITKWGSEGSADGQFAFP
jgi:DNA-binding beta-propeller fold protein YncE